MQHALDAFVSLAGRHPTAALALVALVAFAESLAIVGTVVPAAVVMFGAGALASAAAGLLHDGTPRPMALVMLLALAGSALAIRFLALPRLQAIA